MAFAGQSTDAWMTRPVEASEAADQQQHHLGRKLFGAVAPVIDPKALL
jgi:hypothetical protein